MKSLGVLIIISGAVMAIANLLAFVAGVGESSAVSALLTCISAGLMLPGVILCKAGEIFE